jgi:Uma2 family endonuclease
MVIRNKTVNYAEYIAFTELPENTEHIFEYIDGEIVEKMPSFAPSQLAQEISYHIKKFLKENPIGRLSGEAGGYMMTDDDNPPIFIPDLGYISKARMPDAPTREAPLPPDLAVEIKSPTDRIRALRRKAERYLDYGTQLVWLVFPETQTIEVYAPNQDVQTLSIDDTLDGGLVLPGFQLPLREIFGE